MPVARSLSRARFAGTSKMPPQLVQARRQAVVSLLELGLRHARTIVRGRDLVNRIAGAPGRHCI